VAKFKKVRKARLFRALAIKLTMMRSYKHMYPAPMRLKLIEAINELGNSGHRIRMDLYRKLTEPVLKDEFYRPLRVAYHKRGR